MLRFRGRVVSETVQLELPPGRAPPQGAELELFGQVAEPERDDDFDERTFLRRRGVHVLLRATEWRVVGARGGVGGLADGCAVRSFAAWTASRVSAAQSSQASCSVKTRG